MQISLVSRSTTSPADNCMAVSKHRLAYTYVIFPFPTGLATVYQQSINFQSKKAFSIMSGALCPRLRKVKNR